MAMWEEVIFILWMKGGMKKEMVDSKRGCIFLPHGNKGSHKLQTPTKQVESNVQLLINLSANTMPHQLKGIRNCKYDVRWLLVDMWRSLQKQSDQVSDNV